MSSTNQLEIALTYQVVREKLENFFHDYSNSPSVFLMLNDAGLYNIVVFIDNFIEDIIQHGTIAVTADFYNICYNLLEPDEKLIVERIRFYKYQDEVKTIDFNKALEIKNVEWFNNYGR